MCIILDGHKLCQDSGGFTSVLLHPCLQSKGVGISWVLWIQGSEIILYLGWAWWYSDLNTWREDWKFEVILGCIESVRPAWVTRACRHVHVEKEKGNKNHLPECTLMLWSK